jgi:hypothetical protein
MDTERIDKAVGLLKEGMSLLDSGPLDYYLRRLTACYRALLTLAPYQKGARVCLTKTPMISDKERWGWLCGKHFLMTGAVATVVNVEHDGVRFSYDLVFDADSWVDHHKVIHPRPESQRGTFCFEAEWFERLPETVSECTK